MMKKVLTVLAAAVAVGLLAMPAYADTASDIAKNLNSSHRVYVADGASVKIDKNAADASTVPLVVAAVPASAGDPAALANKIGPKVFPDTRGIAIVISGTKAGYDTNYTGKAASEIRNIGNDAVHQHPLSTGDNATALVKDIVSNVNEARAQDTNSAASSTKKGGGHTGLIIGLIIAVIVIGGIGTFVGLRRRRNRQHLADRRADVISYYDRLGADVQNLDAGDDPVARQAIADAAERYTAAGSQLEQAKSDGQYDSAKRTVLEGLQAARAARIKLGLHPGPELPPVAPTNADRLTEEKEITVGDRTVRGYPDYAPGAPYYYGGGGGYGAGWYSFPFWETLLVGSVLTGGLGGWGGGGYDSGFDSGYDRGFDAGEQAGDQQESGGWGDNSGDWNDSGGGDWGSDGGGNDWGGGDSGGDWGGGGDGGW
jgi:uncharacterized membrane protein YgcG